MAAVGWCSFKMYSHQLRDALQYTRVYNDCCKTISDGSQFYCITQRQQL